MVCKLSFICLFLTMAGCAAESPGTFANASGLAEVAPSKAPAPITSAAAAPQASDLRVMSFNLRCPTFIDGLNYWSFRKELLVQTVRGFDPDVLGTQECVASQADYLRAQLAEYEFVGVGRDDGKRSGEMCGVFFKRDRFDKIDSGNFWLSDRPQKPGSKSWGTWWTRMVTWTKLRRRDNGQTFCLFNTHFDVFGGRARLESAALLRLQMQTIAPGLPCIVTGDFNATPDSDCYRAMTVGKNPLDVKLTDTFRVAHPQEGNAECTMHSFSGKEHGPRIDWILTSGSIQTIAAKIDRNKSGLRYPSDHFPVEAIVRLPAFVAPTKLAAVR
jgi:endonuclease/exonuclease/phosphatase family metal-dependent hydrolase